MDNNLLQVILNKLESLEERVSELNKSTAIYHQQLEIHMKHEEGFEKRFIPVEKHVQRVETAFWLFTSVIGITATIVIIYHNLVA